MNSVLIAKIEVPSYSSAGIVKGLRNNFEVVHEFNYQSIMFDEGAEGMRQRLIGMCMMHNPDILLLHIQNPEPLDLNAVQFMSSRSFVVMYTFDVRDDIDWYKDYAPYVGLILFGDLESVKKMRDAGFDNVDYLSSSADFDLYRPLPNGIKPDKDYGEIVFIGNNFVGSMHKFPLAQQRVDMVNMMKKEFGDRFKVYGMGWPGSRMLNPVEEIAAYHSCKVAITQNNFFRTGYTSDRMWRAMGSGACTISQYYLGYYEDMPPVISQTWDTFPSLVDRCHVLLDNDAFRNQVSIRQNEFVVKHHNWTKRFSEFKELILKHGYDKRMEIVAKSRASASDPKFPMPERTFS